ncbi:MAG: PIG-L deacetylase family protein [Actinomycetota bacterium]
MTGPPFRVLVVTAHPDDMEFGAGGTLAVWADRGAEVTLAIATDGSTGTQDRALMGDALGAVRLEETRRAAEIVGIAEVVWLGYRDGYLEYTLDLRREVARLFRTYRPHRFMVLDPSSTIDDRFINHPDHRAVGQACLDVSMTAGTTPGHFPELLDEGLEPWRGLREVWVMGPGLRPVAVDVGATIDRKIEALLCHESQVGKDADEVSGWVRTSAAETGEAHGVAFAESFRVISQGPGFHTGEQSEDLGSDFEMVPADPRAART